MGFRTISLSDRAYRTLRAEKHPGESFSGVVERLVKTKQPPLARLAGARQPMSAGEPRAGRTQPSLGAAPLTPTAQARPAGWYPRPFPAGEAAGDYAAPPRQARGRVAADERARTPGGPRPHRAAPPPDSLEVGTAMTVCLDTSFLVDLLYGVPEATQFAERLSEPVAIPSVAFYEHFLGTPSPARYARVEQLARAYGSFPPTTRSVLWRRPCRRRSARPETSCPYSMRSSHPARFSQKPIS